MSHNEKAAALMRYRDELKAGCEGDPHFLGLPDAWYDDHVWVCENGHVSTMYLKSEALGGNVCLACHKWVFMFPAHITEKRIETVLAE